MSLARTSPKGKSSLINRLGRTFFLLAATALTVAACSGLPAYSHYEHIDGDGWRRDDSLTFTTCVRDSANYHLMLGLRATNAYPYTQISVNVNILSPNASHLLPTCPRGAVRRTEGRERTSHLTIDITNPDGDMQGRGSNIRQYDVSLGDIVLGSNDTLTVSVRHAMSRFSLPGITDIGLIVKK